MDGMNTTNNSGNQSNRAYDGPLTRLRNEILAMICSRHCYRSWCLELFINSVAANDPGFYKIIYMTVLLPGQPSVMSGQGKKLLAYILFHLPLKLAARVEQAQTWPQ
jgi:hypothetical protein